MTALLKRENLVRWGPVLVLFLLVVVFAAIEPRFLSLRNFARIGVASTPALMIAVGVTFVILMGSIDLSMEGVVSTTAVLFALTFIALGGTLNEIAGWLALPVAILLGAVIGYGNGFIHVRLKVPSFMSTLAIGFVGTGFAMMVTGGERIRVTDKVFRGLLTERWLGFPVMVYVALAAVIVAWFIQSHTRLGRNIYAVGGGEELAHASGVNVERVRILAFMLAGIFYALGALMAVGRIGIAETTTGADLMFIAITSVVVGGTALWGAIGGVFNTLVGVLIVGVINNGMVVIGLPSFIQDGILGVLVIVAVILSTDRRSIRFVK